MAQRRRVFVPESLIIRGICLFLIDESLNKINLCLIFYLDFLVDSRTKMSFNNKEVL